MIRTFLFYCAAMLSMLSLHAQVNWKKVNVLVFTRSDSLGPQGQKLYVHDNITSAANAVTGLGKQHGFSTTITDDPSVFTEDRLKPFTLVVFASTNNDAFRTDGERLAFRRFVESGGGVIGIHSAMGTERNWTWFKNMLGGSFAYHPPNQVYTIRNLRPNHPSMKGMPLAWQKKDECYFMKEIYPGTEVLMAHDLKTLAPDPTGGVAKWTGHYSDLYPAVWYHHYDGGHIWITQLGHDKENYTDPLFLNHLFRGMEFIAGKAAKRDWSKAYATDRDTPLNYR